MRTVLTLLIALPLSIAALLFVRGRIAGHRPDPLWALFGLGCALGAVWEIGFGLLGPGATDAPLFVWIAPGGVPLDPQPVDGGGLGHTLGLLAVCAWDGALFVAGLWIVRWLRPAPTFVRFDVRELAILLAWGQAQSFVIEMIAIAGGLWAYLPRWYNPALFPFMEGQITLAPQAVWLLACPIFYMAALRWPPGDR